MGEGFELTCGTCRRAVVGTQPEKGTHYCPFDCGMWVRNKPNILIRFWRMLKGD